MTIIVEYVNDGPLGISFHFRVGAYAIVKCGDTGA